LQTTSPSYLLLESITEVAELYAKEGQGIVEETIRISKNIQLPRYANNDPYRLIIPGPGHAIEELLAEEKILIEAAYENFALLFINPGNDQADITRLNAQAAAINKLCEKYSPQTISKPASLKPGSFREKFLAGDTEIKAPCPPGIVRSLSADK
jgi:arginine/lysine/ornithine decarboxylase